LLEKRDSGGVRATAQGQLFAEASRSALHAMQQAVEAVREQRSSYSVSVSTTPSFAVRWLLPRLPPLQRSYRGSRFQSSSISVWMNPARSRRTSQSAPGRARGLRSSQSH